MKKHVKIALISSRGGHLFQLVRLRPFWSKYRRFWVTFEGKDTQSYIGNEKKYLGHYPDSRNIINVVRNFFLACWVLVVEKPTHIISMGAALAVPFFIVGKILGAKLIFLEPYDFVAYPSLTGRIIYQFADQFIVQHAVQKKWYPKAKYLGSVL